MTVFEFLCKNTAVEKLRS